MCAKFERRNHTNGWWRIHLERVMERGKQLKEHGNFKSLEDLKAHKDEIGVWLREAADKIRDIYLDPSVAEEWCRPVGEIDFNNQSWKDIITSLDRVVDERLQGFSDLIYHTEP